MLGAWPAAYRAGRGSEGPEMTQQRIDVLRSTAMFGAVSDETIAFLLQRARTRTVEPGAWFFEQGERGTSTFLLERGRASVIKIWDDRAYALRELSAGDCFGEVALLDFGPRSAGVRADQACEALELSALDLRRLAERDAEQFALIYMNLGRELSRRLRDADERLFCTRFRIAEPDTVAGYEFSVP
jgi:CRP-like cAMP-binding protein